MRNRKKYRVYRVRSNTLLVAAVCLVAALLGLGLIVTSFLLWPRKKPSAAFSSTFTYEESAPTVSETQSSSSETESTVSEVSAVASSFDDSERKTVPESSVQAVEPAPSSTAPAEPAFVYDVLAAAPEWTYAIDKSAPVVLQPAVDDNYFNDVLFVGDSITTGIDLYSIMKNANVVAYTGINTNTVMTRAVIPSPQGKETFLQAMNRYHPKAIYIMMGINGLAWQSKAALISGYAEFLDAVKAQHPYATIYLQSILPVTDKKQRADARFSNDKIRDYNAAILKLAAEKDVYYLNVAESFYDAFGNLPNSAAPKEGIHFGPSCYRRWIEYLKRHTVPFVPPAETEGAPQ